MSKLASLSRSQKLSLAIDAVCALGGSACLGLFIYNSLHASGFDTSGRSRIATIYAGDFERKRLGTVAFFSAPAGTPVYDRDALWLGEGESGEIVFTHGGRLKVGEKTFLVLRAGNEGLLEPEVLRGTVTVIRPEFSDLASAQTITISAATGPSGTPSATPSGSPAVLQADPTTLPSAAVMDYHPKPDTLFLLVSPQKNVEITFAWPEPVTGTLRVTTAAGAGGQPAEVASVAIPGEKFVKALLPGEGRFSWVILDASGKPLCPLMHFTIKAYDAKAMKGELGQQNTPIEIIQ